MKRIDKRDWKVGDSFVGNRFVHEMSVIDDRTHGTKLSDNGGSRLEQHK